MTYDASNTKDVRRAEKASRLADQNRREVVASLASSTAGRRYLWDQLAAANVFSSCYSEVPLRMAFLEGERNAGLRLLDDLTQFCPDQFLEMIREANGRRTESDARDNANPRSTGEPDGSPEPGWELEGSTGDNGNEA